MSIPITSRIRSSRVFDQASRNALSPEDLSVWADDLLSLGLASDAIVLASCNPDYPTTKIQDLLKQICMDLQIDTSAGFERIKEDSIIEEYRNGHFSPAHILFACNEFRIRTGFPEQLHAKFVYDGGIEHVTYHGLETGISGDELESTCIEHLTRHDINRNPDISG